MSACAFKSSARALGQVCARLACLLPSIRHCYYLMQRRTHVKQRRAECPVNVLQAYTRQSKTTSTITSKSFENFRRHFLKINFRYNVRFLSSTATYISYLFMCSICKSQGIFGLGFPCTLMNLLNISCTFKRGEIMYSHCMSRCTASKA